jgi:REP element-mobilizing transposase RayT
MRTIERRSIRLPGYDYSQPGFYFVTVCSQRRKPIFGRVVEGEVVLSEEGEIAREEWFRTASLRDYVNLYENELVVMPNHIHGVIHFVPNVGARRRRAPTDPEKFGSPSVGSLSTVMRAFKSNVTRRINLMYGTPGKVIWQRNYYEHVIRGEEELYRIRRYISENPLRWSQDRYYCS